MAKARQHEEGSGKTSAQRSSSDLQWRSYSSGGDREAGAAEEGEETHETGDDDDDDDDDFGGDDDDDDCGDSGSGDV